MKLLVTRAGGYIGSITTRLFLEKGYEVVGLDNFSRGYEAPLKLLQHQFGKTKLRYYKADLNETSGIIDNEGQIDAVVHFAALCLVDESMKKPGKYFNNNVCGTLSLLQAMQKHRINKLVFSSTCAVYGEAQYVPLDEKTSYQPH